MPLAVFWLLLFAPDLGTAQPSGDEILRKMAATYAKINAVHIEADRLDEVQYPGQLIAETTQYDFAVRDQGRVRLRQKMQSGEEFWVIGNGDTTWRARAREKKWAAMNAGALVGGNEETEESAGTKKAVDLRTEVQTFLFSRAIAVGRNIKGATLAKSQSYKLAGGERVLCDVVRFQHGLTEHELWIDQPGSRVLQWTQVSTKVDVPGFPVKTKVVLKIKKFATGEGVPDSLFAFTPPKGWQETEIIVFPSEGRITLTGQRAASFSLPTLTGKTVSLATLRGKVVVLDFWGSWCLPCREEMPLLEKINKELAARNEVFFVGVNSEDAGTARKFVEKNNYEIPVLLDSKWQVNSSYNITAIPTLFVIDREGVIRQHLIGKRGEDVLRKAILEVVEGK